MATYYVSPSGNDAAAGTSSGTAFKTLTKAQTAMSTSDTAILMTGTFTLASPFTLTSADNNTTWIADSGATPVISGDNKEMSLITMTGATGITISGLTFIDTVGGADLTGWDSAPAAVEINGGDTITVTGSMFDSVAVGVKAKDDASNVTISDSTFTDTQSTAIFFEFTHENLATNNTILRASTKYIDGAAIELMETWGTTVSHNVIDNVPRHGIEEQNFDAGNKSGQNIIEYNVVTRYMQNTVDGGGIYLFAGDDPTAHLGTIVRYNYVDGAGADAMSWGIYLDDYISNGTIVGNFVNGQNGGVAPFMIHGGDNNTVSNNVFIGGGLYGITVQESAINPSDPIFGNNIHHNLIAPGPSGIFGGLTVTDPNGPLQFHDNVYVGSGSQVHFGWDGETFAQWQGIGGDAGSDVTTSAGFVNPGAGDYTFAPGSVALAQGIQQLPFDDMGLTDGPGTSDAVGFATGVGSAHGVSSLAAVIGSRPGVVMARNTNMRFSSVGKFTLRA